MQDEKKSTAIAVREEAPRALLLRPAPVAEVLQARKDLLDALPKLLEEGVDYDTIKGTTQPTLLQPGAQNINALMSCVSEFEIVESEIDHDREVRYRSPWVEAPDPGWDEKERRKRAGLGKSKQVDGQWVWFERGETIMTSFGLYRYVVRCNVRHQETGRIVGSSLGVCSTLESKYIDRPRDLENTIVKMASKRAEVGAVLRAFRLSQRFTQDVDEMADVIDMRAPPRSADRPSSSNGSGRTASSPGPTPEAVAPPTEADAVREMLGFLEKATELGRVERIRARWSVNAVEWGLRLEGWTQGLDACFEVARARAESRDPDLSPEEAQARVDLYAQIGMTAPALPSEAKVQR
jgi:hypothetical protein